MNSLITPISKYLIFISIVLGLASPGFAQNEITFTDVQVDRGLILYTETCQICHGNRLSNGQFGTPLRGRLFRNNWENKPLGQLVQQTWEKMPPDNMQSLTWEQVTDVIAFIFSKNNKEAGNTAMTTEMEILITLPIRWD